MNELTVASFSNNYNFPTYEKSYQDPTFCLPTKCCLRTWKTIFSLVFCRQFVKAPENILWTHLKIFPRCPNFSLHDTHWTPDAEGWRTGTKNDWQLLKQILCQPNSYVKKEEEEEGGQGARAGILCLGKDRGRKCWQLKRHLKKNLLHEWQWAAVSCSYPMRTDALGIPNRR